MRLNRFALTRYGKFTDTAIPFPAPQPGKPDIHLIYGPNEAGKSTFLSAWLDFLFEFPTRSPMDFLHAYSALRLDAQLDLNGETSTLTRLKRRTGSLLDQNEATVPETALNSALHGLNRDSYASMFSLDRLRLNEGGESILASKGDLGALLFQASAGLTDLTAQLDAAHKDSETFLSRSGRKGHLRDLRAELDAINDQIKAQDTAATEFARLTKDRDTASETLNKARATTLEAQRDLSGTERKIAALPFARRLRRLDEQLAGFQDLPDVKPDWIADLAALDRAETTLNADLQHGRDRLTALDKALAQMSTDDAVLALSDRIEQAETLKAAHDTALIDLPKRIGERDTIAAQIEDRLNRLGFAGADAADLVPDLPVMSGLRAQSERFTTLDAKLHASKVEEQQAQDAVREAADALGADTVDLTDTATLERLVQNLRGTDPLTVLDRLLNDRALLEVDLSKVFAELGISDWSPADLLQIPSPDLNALTRLEQDETTARRDVERLSAQLEETRHTHDSLTARLRAMQATGTATPQEVADARARREAAWSTHKATLSAQTAQDFEQAMRLDDHVTAALAAQQSRAERMAELTAEVEEKTRLRDQITSHLQIRTDALNAITDRILDLVAPLPVPSPLDLSGLRNWLTRFSVAKDLATRHAALAAQIGACETQIQRAGQDLTAALQALGVSTPPEAGLRLRLETAVTVLDRANRARGLREKYESAENALRKRRAAVVSAQAELDSWSADWSRMAGKSWLAQLSPTQTPLRPILDELDQLRNLLEKRLDLTRRINAMQGNVALFTDAVDALISDLKLEGKTSWSEIRRRLGGAQNASKRVAELRADRQTAALALDTLQAKARQHQTRTAEITQHFGTSDWATVFSALTRAAQRADLQQARVQCAEDLCNQLHLPDEQLALNHLGDSDEDLLSARRQTLEAAVAGAQTAQDLAHSVFLDADRALQDVGGDDAVARLQTRRQTLLLQIEEAARAHLRKRLGLLSLDRALHAFRNTHRSEMLNRASDAFHTMTRGRYDRLVAQPDGTQEVLAAISDSGASLLADHLSEGTREQLYLALRIAGYHEFIRQKGPVPFIADDIMESFDDDRAGAAFRLLADMACHGQVIYLTHHAHMRDLAKAHCPDVTVHDLSP